MKIMKLTTSRERRVIIVSTFLMILVGITTLNITITGCILGYCHMKIASYNSQPIKTDPMTEYIEHIYEVRQDVYDSECVLTRSFARLKYIKIPVILVALGITSWIIGLQINNRKVLKNRIKRRKERLKMLSKAEEGSN